MTDGVSPKITWNVVLSYPSYTELSFFVFLSLFHTCRRGSSDPTTAIISITFIYIKCANWKQLDGKKDMQLSLFLANFKIFTNSSGCPPTVPNFNIICAYAVYWTDYIYSVCVHMFIHVRGELWVGLGCFGVTLQVIKPTAHLYWLCHANICLFEFWPLEAHTYWPLLSWNVLGPT